jgi:hypothetical protein
MVGLGIVAIAAGPHRARLGVLVAPAAVAAVVLLTTPLGHVIVQRTTEVNKQGSSSSERLVEPYSILLPRYAATAPSVVVGRGPGSAVTALSEATSNAVIAPAVPKLLYEYGFVGTVPFLLFVLYNVWGGRGERPWGLALLVGYLVLNPALLQPTFALATILFGRFLRGPAPKSCGSVDAARRHPVSAVQA